jgi:hypothetical protein
MPYELPAVLFADPAVTAVAWRNVCVVRWTGNASTHTLQRLIAASRPMHNARGGARVASLTLLEAATLALPDAATRALIDQHRHDVRDTTLAEALVLPGGLVAATIRGFIAGITLARRLPYPTRVVPTLEAACQFLAPLLEPVHGQPVDPVDLAATLGTARGSRT